MAEKTTIGELMEELMVILDDNLDGMGSGAYDEITRELKKKYDELDKEDVLVKKPWRETNYKVKYMSLAPRRREFRFNQKNYRKEFVSKIDYQYKTGIFVGKSLSKIYDSCLSQERKDRIDNGEQFHQVINETIKEWNRPYEGMFDTKGSFLNNCDCCITMTVCDSECEYDDSDDCECDKCSDIEVRATPVYILRLEKVIP